MTTLSDHESSMSICLEDMDKSCLFYKDDVIMEDEEAQSVEEDKIKLVTKETRTVLAFRSIFAIVLLGAAVGVSATVFLYSRGTEKQIFERDFADNGQKIVDQ